MATGGNHNHTSLEPLKGAENFATWKIQCKMALMRDGLWGFVTGTEERPPDRDVANLAKYKKQLDKAVATVVLAVDPSLLYLLGEPSCPVTVWNTLCAQFQRKTWANKLHLRKKLYALKLQEGGSVQKHIKAITEIFNELAVVGDVIEEEDKVVHLLASLPDSFNILVTALEASENVPRMDVVLEKIRQQELKVTSVSSGETEKVLLSQSSKPKHRHDFPKKKSGPKCYHCGEIGHVKKECYHLKNSQTAVDNKKPQRANTVESGKPEVTEVVGLTVSNMLSSELDKQDRWIIDSGATCHMCRDISMFENYKKLDMSQDVILGDGHHLRALGCGSIFLEVDLLDGTSGKVELRDVLHVPGLSYNLFSVSKAASSREIKNTVFTEKECRWINLKDKTVATGSKIGELYFLNVVSNVSCTLAAAENSLELWHQRYGHLGESNITKLVKSDMVDGITENLTGDIGVCEDCVVGKCHRKCFPTTGARRYDKVLDLVHSDVCGKVSSESL